MSNSLQPYGLWPTRLLCSWDSPGKNTGMGCHTLPRHLCLLHWQVGSLPLASSGKPCVCVCVCVCVCMCKYITNLELPRWLSGKESACQCRRRRDSGSIPGQKNLLEKEIATHSNILAWEIPWMDESGRFQSTGYKDSDTT